MEESNREKTNIVPLSCQIHQERSVLLQLSLLEYDEDGTLDQTSVIPVVDGGTEGKSKVNCVLSDIFQERQDCLKCWANKIMGFQKNVTYHCKRAEEITSLLITDFIVTTMNES